MSCLELCDWPMPKPQKPFTTHGSDRRWVRSKRRKQQTTFCSDLITLRSHHITTLLFPQTLKSTTMVSDNTKIGTGLLFLGIVFLFLGVLFLFDSAMLALGDILFLVGLTMTIGEYLQWNGPVLTQITECFRWIEFSITNLKLSAHRCIHFYSLFFHTCRRLEDSPLLLSARSYSWDYFLLFGHFLGDDSVAYLRHDSAILWSHISLWTILPHRCSIHERHTGHWRRATNAGDRKFLWKFLW